MVKRDPLDKTIRNLMMLHLTDRELAAHHDGVLEDGVRRARVEAHLKHCLICQSRLRFLEEVIAEAEGMQPLEISATPESLGVEKRLQKLGKSLEHVVGQISERVIQVPHVGSADTVLRPNETLVGRTLEADRCIWINNTPYPSNPTATDPTLCKIDGLSRSSFLLARKADHNNPGSRVVRIEWAGRTIVIPLSHFIDPQGNRNVNEGEGASRPKVSLNLAATTRESSPAGESHPPTVQTLIQILRCPFDGGVIEILSNADRAVFYRISEG